MTTLITGASGFVGRRLARSLVERGHSIRTCVREPDMSLSSDQVLVPQPGISIDHWRTLIRGCDNVIHLIARAHILNELDADPLTAFREINTNMTQACATAAALEGVRRFVFVSSIGVLGNATSNRPLTVTDSLAPHSPYAISKAEAEQVVRGVAESHSMEWTIVRPPLVYGPKARGNVRAMMKALEKRIPLPFGCVTQNQRSLIALDNLVDLLITCINHPAAANQTFLASDGEDLSTADLLRRLGHAMGCPTHLLPVPTMLLWAGARLLGRGDMAQQLLGSLQVDIGHTRCTLDWTPPISVDEGFRLAAEERL